MTTTESLALLDSHPAAGYSIVLDYPAPDGRQHAASGYRTSIAAYADLDRQIADHASGWTAAYIEGHGRDGLPVACVRVR